MATIENGSRICKEASVTDVPAYWLTPSPANFASPFQKIREMDFRSAATKRKALVSRTHSIDTAYTSSDVLSTPITPCNTFHSAKIPQPTTNEEETFYAGLYRECPNAVALSLHSKYSDSFVPKAMSKSTPIHLGQLYDPNIAVDNYSTVLSHCDTVDISISAAQVEYVLQETKSQSKSKLWSSMREGRVTASLFYAACHTRIEKPAISVLRSICNPQCFSSAATEWGSSNENNAKEQYVLSQNAQHTDFSCNDCGLFLNTDYPMFGATPDGLVSCTCCGCGVVEIKCPFTLQRADINDLDWLVTDDNDKLRLKRTHRYYYQVQMQLFITNRQYCDFVVWSPSTLYTERIMPDRAWWEEKSQQGMLFHARCIMPELCAKYFTRRSVMSCSVENAVADNSQNMFSIDTNRYCLCGGADDGRKMIACDDENCSVQWYHVKCLNMKRVPKDKWFCPQCRGSSTKKRKL